MIDVDPGLSNLETGDNNSKGHKSAPFPEWFKRALAEKLAIIEKRSSSGELIFYEEHQTFWVPQKAKWFLMKKTKSLQPELLYDFQLFYWDPQLLTRIKCPKCQVSYLTRHGLQKRPRRCIDLENSFWMIGAWY